MEVGVFEGVEGVGGSVFEGVDGGGVDGISLEALSDEALSDAPLSGEVFPQAL